MKKLLALVILTLISIKITAQSTENKNSTFYINVFINENKDIRIESELVEFENLSKEIKKRIYEHPFKVDETVTYRIFADKNLMLGYIMDVENEMFESYRINNKTRRERYLLETVKKDIDGPNWLKKLEGIKLDTIKG